MVNSINEELLSQILISVETQISICAQKIVSTHQGIILVLALKGTMEMVDKMVKVALLMVINY